MDRLNAIAEVTIEAAKGDKPPQISVLAYGGNIMHVAPHGAVAIDVAALRTPESIPLLADHDNALASIVGVGSPVKSGNQLGITGSITTATDAGKMLVGLARDGIKLQASIGVEISERKRLKAGETTTLNGQSITAPAGGLTIITAGDLRETSIVAVGADASTSVVIAAQRNLKMATANENENEIRASERERLAEITRLCSPTGNGWGNKSRRVDELRASALDGAISVDELRAALLDTLRTARPTAPAMDGGGRPAESNVMEASICLTAGIDSKSVGGWYGEPVTNEALSARMRNIGIHGLMRAVLRAASMPIPDRFTASDIRTAFEADRMLRAGGAFSTLSLPGILGNVANKSMLESYKAVATTWQLFCSVASNSDFKTHTRYRLTGSGQFEEVAKAGTIHHVTLTEESYTNILTTQGAMHVLTRQDIISDDLSALTRLPRIFGRMAAVALEKSVYTLLLSNPGSPAFFSTTNDNYDDGTDSALGLDSLTAAERMFLEQTDSNGDPLLVKPVILLAPPALSGVAAQLVSTITPTLVGSTTANSLLPAANPHSGRFSPAITPWLSNDGLTGNSDDAWYLLANPSDIAIMEVAFLNGVTSPTIESGDTDFNTLGMQWRSYWDFGVAMQDYRGGVKMKGTT